MRSHLMRRVLSCAAFGMFGMLGQAQAAILDFEDLAPALVFSGDSVAQSNFMFTQQGDFGVVGADFLVAVPPIGNTTTFYSGLNDSALVMTQSNGVAFNIFGFDAGFLAPVQQGPGVIAGRMVLQAENINGVSLQTSWEFAASDGNGDFSFQHFDTGLAGFTNLVSATFSACIYDDTNACVNPAENLAQYSLDNINAAIPEPSTYALMVLGLAGVVAYSRRRSAR